MDLKSEPISNLDFHGYYKRLSDFYDNASAVDALRGTREYGFNAAYLVNPNTLIRGQYIDEKDELNDMDSQLALIGAEKSFNKAKIFMDLSKQSG